MKFVLIIFTTVGFNANVITAQMSMKRFECIKEAIKVNTEGKNRWAACMPLAIDR